MSRNTISLGIWGLLLAAGCAGGGGGGDGSALEVSGVVRDFQTGDMLTGSVSVSTEGLEPAPIVIADAGSFELDNVAPHSVFSVLAAAPPQYRATYGATVDVEEDDVHGVNVSAVSEAYLGQLATAFGVSPTAATGVLFAQAVDGSGHPRAGVAADALIAPPGADGPYFLDAVLAPDPGANETSASGWMVYFEVTPGIVGLEADPTSGVTADMALSPVAPAVATVAAVKITDGAQPLPTNVSFAHDVVPIFQARGCQSCHSGSGPGRDLGHLTLDGSDNLIFKELTTEAAFTAPTALRVNLADPEASLVLTMPSREDPPDDHPTIVFASPADPDYLTILVWIREGAKQN